MVRESIRTSKLESRNMDHGEVKVCQIKEPVGLVMVQCLGFVEVS